MTKVAPGDIILHFTDNSGITGISVAAGVADTTFQGVPGTAWGERASYRVPLENFIQLDPPLTRDSLFEDGETDARLKEIAADHTDLFYSGLQLRQGAYLTQAPDALVNLLVKVYQRTTGKVLPYLGGGTKLREQKLDRDALERLKSKFLLRYPDFRDLTFTASQGSYWDDERGYKQTLIDQAQDSLRADPALSPTELGNTLLNVLTTKPSNLLNWRTQDRLAKIRKANPGVIERAGGELAKSNEKPPASVARFVTQVWPLFEVGNEANLPFGDIRAIPTMVLALAKPEAAIAVRYQPFHNAGIALLDRPLFANSPLTATEYDDVIGMANQIFEIMSREWLWAPRDLWDVQGFIWATCRDMQDVGVDDPVKDDNHAMTKDITEPINLILYGPPGTGKTYATADEAVRICDGALPVGGRKALMTRYRELVARKRIEFVTFHQSFGYEEFVEGLRPETSSTEGADTESVTGGFQLVPRPGVFRLIADRASANRGGVAEGPNDLEHRQAFKMSLGRSRHDEDAYLFDECINGGFVLLGYGGEIDWSDPAYASFDAIKNRWRKVEPDATGSSPNIQQIYALRAWMQLNDIVIVSDGNKRFRAIGEITGPYQYVKRERDDYHHRRAVRWLWVQRDGLPREEIYKKGFSQVAIYRLNRDEVNWPALAQIISGSGKLGAGSPEPYVLVVDEINRANVSKVFGDIITLIEPDKRQGMENALTVTLPYSGDVFGVPANLHIIGTMNTADRSIALLDTALRRRFRFKEVMPNAFLLSDDIEGVNIRKALQGMNARIEYLFDRDHQIGHAYFMGCTTRAKLEAAMCDKIIPLLVEYFYENWEKVRAVLNETENDGAFIVRTPIPAPQSSPDQWGAENERWRYAVKKSFAPMAFAQLEL